ncbi:MAG: hypothetical protein AVDCRST_MAG30-4309, partial [uncultured Solirubrobacteraceae bacterium]
EHPDPALPGRRNHAALRRPGRRRGPRHVVHRAHDRPGEVQAVLHDERVPRPARDHPLRRHRRRDRGELRRAAGVDPRHDPQRRLHRLPRAVEDRPPPRGPRL